MNLEAELGAIRQDLAQLRQLVEDLHGALIGEAKSPSTSTLLARPNAHRLAAEVQRRFGAQALGAESDDDAGDTELDLLIDRLHDLALEQEP
ncbi:hypothetical protein KBY58_11350 [Cyanobium sp. HWJ4-Hawea]|uniref:hypothetical protein n=1 Tax=Cyanobium sp. HWJ4-Hawea TaxID=2823713 RepID=UPI0020CF630C|nr:hypothetical protein [Cyanobium sp. HWJ4-Hawea]MCP9810030.1 hypothetical protein [Cyanobium sp. HWJ4-Hawea]